MRKLAISAALIWAMALPVRAQAPAELPWNKDLAALNAAAADLTGGRIAALGPHAAEFEAALDHGKSFFPGGVTVDGTTYMLADGTTERLMVLMKSAIAAKPEGAAGHTALVVANFYPVMALGLASYYDETGKPQDAIRALDKGLALSVNPQAALGAHVGAMLGEKGFALGSLKRYAEALAVYDQGLTNKAVVPPDRARLYRGRGFILTEMDRLDDAEAAYRASLEIEPSNPRALGELNYIAKLKAGGPKAPVQSVLAPQPEPLAPQQTPPQAPAPLPPGTQPGP
jgi:tetratricopeptide (TPR) repeat protein